MITLNFTITDGFIKDGLLDKKIFDYHNQSTHRDVFRKANFTDVLNSIASDLLVYGRSVLAENMAIAVANIEKQRDMTETEKFYHLTSVDYGATVTRRKTKPFNRNDFDSISVLGQGVYFIEFGTGVHFNGTGSPHPWVNDGKHGEASGFAIGSYGKHKGLQDSWMYVDESGLLFETYGTQAQMPVYKTYISMLYKLNAMNVTGLLSVSARNKLAIRYNKVMRSAQKYDPYIKWEKKYGITYHSPDSDRFWLVKAYKSDGWQSHFEAPMGGTYAIRKC